MASPSRQEFVSAFRAMQSQKVSSAKFLRAVEMVARATSFGGVLQMETFCTKATQPSASLQETCGSVSQTMHLYGLVPKIVQGMKSSNEPTHRACAKFMANMSHWDDDCVPFVQHGGHVVRILLCNHE